MNIPTEKIETGINVVVARLLDLDWLEPGEHKDNRTLEATGTLCAWLGRDKQRLWVNHGNGCIAEYSPNELELLN